MTADARESQARTPFDPLDGEALAQAILTRRRRLCIAEETHTAGGACPSCGL
jgi:hypothetical protein